MKPSRSDKLGDQVEFIQSFNESTYETLHYAIKFKFIFIMAKCFPVDIKPWLALMAG